jgi:purine-nucleoside phosphorylase
MADDDTVHLTRPHPRGRAYACANDAAAAIRERFGVDTISTGLILGTGWGAALEAWGAPEAEAPMHEIPGFMSPTTVGQPGLVRLYHVDGVPTLVMVGRTHLFEGHGCVPVVHPVRVLGALGARSLILTGVSGTFHPQWPLGQVVAIKDHLNLSWVSPFPDNITVDLSQVYDPALRERVVSLDPNIVSGVFAMFSGRTYETVTEAYAAKNYGADLVGMSTVLEAIAAVEYGFRTLGLSVVTMHESGGGEIDQSSVVAIAEAAARRCSPLLRALVAGS